MGVEDLLAALEAAQQRVQRGPVVTGLLAHCHVDRTPGGSGHQNSFSGACAAARSARSEWVFPAAAGALRGCTSRCEVAMAVTARA